MEIKLKDVHFEDFSLNKARAEMKINLSGNWSLIVKGVLDEDVSNAFKRYINERTSTNVIMKSAMYPRSCFAGRVIVTSIEREKSAKDHKCVTEVILEGIGPLIEDDFKRYFQEEEPPKKKKFTLEFDEAPALLFVSHGHNKEEVYLDGKRIKDWTGIEIHSEVEEATTYKLSGFALKE